MGRPAGGTLYGPAEGAFRKGLRAIAASQTKVARALFEAAIQLERGSGAAGVQPRYRSYLGLTLLEDPSKRAIALDYCRRAAEEEFFNPDLFLNLSRVHLRLGNRAEAHRAATRGLALDPRHPALALHMAALGIRREPPLRFLARSNFLNMTLGRMIRKGTGRTTSRPENGRAIVQTRPGGFDRQRAARGSSGASPVSS